MKSSRILCLLALVFALASSALAQGFSLSVYVPSDSDGSIVYGDAILQYTVDMCSLCGSSYHTYTQTLTLTGPLGEQSNCGNSIGGSATDDQYITCNVGLVIGDDEGDYSLEDDVDVECSSMGPLINGALFGPPIGIEKSSYHIQDAVAFGSGYWISWATYGGGCPGHCGEDHSTYQYDENQAFKQCLDVLKNGSCYSKRIFCWGISSGGKCSVPSPAPVPVPIPIP
jgi:hypothetical protein